MILYKQSVLIKTGENEQRYIDEIPVLEYLNTKTPLNATKALSLTGTIKINTPGIKVNEFDLHQKYIVDMGYSGITFEYDDSM